MNCINVSSKEYKDLVEAARGMGMSPQVVAMATVAYQMKNKDNFPNLDYVSEFSKTYIESTYDSSIIATNPNLVLGDKKFIANTPQGKEGSSYLDLGAELLQRLGTIDKDIDSPEFKEFDNALRVGKVLGMGAKYVVINIKENNKPLYDSLLQKAIDVYGNPSDIGLTADGIITSLLRDEVMTVTYDTSKMYGTVSSIAKEYLGELNETVATVLAHHNKPINLGLIDENTTPKELAFILGMTKTPISSKPRDTSIEQSVIDEVRKKITKIKGMLIKMSREDKGAFKVKNSKALDDLILNMNNLDYASNIVNLMTTTSDLMDDALANLGNIVSIENTTSNGKKLDALNEYNVLINAVKALAMPDVELGILANDENYKKVKAAFVGKVETLEYKLDGVTKQVVARALKEVTVEGEADLASIEAGLDSAKQIGVLEKFLGALASSPDKILALFARKFSEYKYNAKQALMNDVETLMEASKKFTNFEWMYELDKDGNMYGNLTDELSHQYYIDKVDYIRATKDEYGRNLEFYSGTTAEAKAHNLKLQEAIGKIASFAKETTREDEAIEFSEEDRAMGITTNLTDYVANLPVIVGTKIKDYSGVPIELFEKYFRASDRVVLTENGSIEKVEPARIDGRVNPNAVISIKSEFRKPIKEEFIYKERGNGEGEFEPNPYYNAKFKALSDEQKGFLALYKDVYNKYGSKLPNFNNPQGMIASVEGEQAKEALSMVDKVKASVVSAKESFAQADNVGISGKTKVNSTDYSIPVFFDRKVAYKNAEQVAKVEEKLKGEQDPVKRELLEKQLTKLKNQLDPSMVEANPMRAMINFMEMASNYGAKSELESTLSSLRGLSKNRKIQKTKSLTEKDIIDQDGNPVYEKDDMNRLDDMLENWAYTVFYEAGRYEELAVWEEVLLSASRMASKATLGLNPRSALTNSLMGRVGAMIESAGKMFYSYSDLRKAAVEYDMGIPGLITSTKDNPSDLSIILKHFDIFEKPKLASMETPFESSFYKKAMTSDMLFILDNIVEHGNQSKVLLSMMNSHRIVDGQIMTYLDYRKAFEGGSEADFKKSPTLRESIKVVNGKVIMPELNERQQFLFTERVKGVVQKIYGRYTKDDASYLQRYAIGRVLLQFKRWFGAIYEDRFKPQYYDYRLRQEVEGRYRIIIKYASHLIKKAMRMDSQFDWKNLTDVEKANMRSTLLDVGFMLSFMAISMLAFNATDEDDDEDERRVYNFLGYQTARLASELTTLISPESWNSLTESPLAAVGFIQDFSKFMFSIIAYPFRNDEENYIDYGVNKGDSFIYKYGSALTPFKIFNFWEQLTVESYNK